MSDPSARYFTEMLPDSPDVYFANESLFAEVNGRKYLITNDYLESDPYKSVEAVRDLDGDGLAEAIISIRGSGTCCGPSFAIVSDRGNGFFSVSELEIHGFPVVEIIEQDNQPLILVHGQQDGIENTSIEETQTIFRFEHGNLVLISKMSNASLLYAEQVFNSSDFASEESRDKSQVIEAMLDEDDILDTLECKYWARWGTLNCEINSSLHGQGVDAPTCDRVGVLSTKTNGMNDLVCRRRDVFVFDGKGYNKL